VARRIQARLLPDSPPRVPGLEIAGHYEPAREVGGDYFDHVAIGDGRVLLVIADVSGKSVPAALIMSGFRAALLSQDLARGEPAVLAGRLNDLLHASLEPGKFVTAFLGFLDGRSGRFVYVNAGHNPPLVIRRDGSHAALDQGGTLLGIQPSSVYAQGEIVLAPGEMVALYTDGVTEGADPTGQQWGDGRLIEMLRNGRSEPCAALAQRIASAVRAFEGAPGATDDITLLIARRLG
jgi:sigma-B regulation protein RsbU (phosphoserine phosphatase)